METELDDNTVYLHPALSRCVPGTSWKNMIYIPGGSQPPAHTPSPADPKQWRTLLLKMCLTGEHWWENPDQKDGGKGKGGMVSLSVKQIGFHSSSELVDTPEAPYQYATLSSLSAVPLIPVTLACSSFSFFFFFFFFLVPLHHVLVSSHIGVLVHGIKV